MKTRLVHLLLGAAMASSTLLGVAMVHPAPSFAKEVSMRMG
jgi:hypothetical protein